MAQKYRMALIDALKQGGGVDLVEFFKNEVNWQKYCEKHRAEHGKAPGVKENDFKDWEP